MPRDERPKSQPEVLATLWSEIDTTLRQQLGSAGELLQAFPSRAIPPGIGSAQST